MKKLKQLKRSWVIMACVALAIGALMLPEGVGQVALFLLGVGLAAAAIVMPVLVFVWGVAYRLALQPVENRIRARWGDKAADRFRLFLGVPGILKPASVKTF